MLFDLRSPGRRRFIKVIYAGLALLMGGGLILFGIGGGSGSGGLLDAIGLTNSNGSGGSSGFSSQISAAEKKVQANPNDAQAQLALAIIHTQAARQELKVDQKTGQLQPSPNAEQDLQRAADAWVAYLKLNPKHPSAGGAVQMAQGFYVLAQLSTSYADAQTNLQSAAKAQQIAVQSTPSLGAYATLAQYEYLSGNTAAGDAAIKQAKAAGNPSQTTSLAQFVAQIKKVGASFQKALAASQKAAKKSPSAPGSSSGAAPLTNPLGGSGLSGGSGLGP